MKFGVREICEVTFKAKNDMTIGSSTFKKGQPVMFIDTATTSTLEQATTTVYAQGGRGNTRLVTWEGEKELTFTVTDALLSDTSLSVLSGAGLFKANDDTTKVHVHKYTNAVVNSTGSSFTIDVSAALETGESIDDTAPLFVSILDNEDITGNILGGFKAVANSAGDLQVLEVASSEIFYNGTKMTSTATTTTPKADDMASQKVFVDFYITKLSKNVSEIQIDADSFGGNFYVEAETLFRAQDGTDYPAILTLPNVKIQSNFTFEMAATGDPSTFDFTMDAMPDYTYFDNTHKVMCVIQVVDESAAGASTKDSVMKHDNLTDSLTDSDSSANSGSSKKQ